MKASQFGRALGGLAILLQFAELNRFRGDDVDKDVAPQTDGNLSPQITNLLRRFRDPVLR